MNTQYITLIRTLPTFTGYTEHGAQRLVEMGKIEDFPAGQVLFREGDAPDSVLLVLTGRTSVFVDRNGREMTLTESGPGTILGELAVLSGKPRAASVRTIEPSTILKWSDKSFRRLLLGDAWLAERIFAASINMLVEKEQALIEALVHAQSQAGPSQGSPTA